MMPGLIHKCYLAKGNNNNNNNNISVDMIVGNSFVSASGQPLTVFGTGKPLRQFIYSRVRFYSHIVVIVLLKCTPEMTIIITPSEE